MFTIFFTQHNPECASLKGKACPYFDAWSVIYDESTTSGSWIGDLMNYNFNETNLIDIEYLDDMSSSVPFTSSSQIPNNNTPEMRGTTLTTPMHVGESNSYKCA
jgi:hypothetical protein